MFIQIDFFKPTGKWYSGGTVELTDGTYLWKDDFKQQIVNNQKIMCDGWQEHDWIVVVRDTPANELNPSYNGFFYHLFLAGAFKGIKNVT